MILNIQKKILEYRSWKFHSFFFYPKNPPLGVALFAHGYTSHKGSILNWGSRLAEEGYLTALIDLPGHYLGSFNEVEDFMEFTQFSEGVFSAALRETGIEKPKKLILGGHSLGALLALKAAEKLKNSDEDISVSQIIAVGLGMPPADKEHVFDSPFYKSTLALREQLVSPALSPDKVFPWIKKEKENLKLNQQKIHFICGEDDVVVGPEGAEKMVELLAKQGNKTSIEKPRKLPHHNPELAGAHIKKFLKDEGFFSA